MNTKNILKKPKRIQKAIFFSFCRTLVFTPVAGYLCSINSHTGLCPCLCVTPLSPHLVLSPQIPRDFPLIQDFTFRPSCGMNIGKKQKSVCVPILPRPVHVSISVQSTHPCRAKFRVSFPPRPLSLLAFKVPAFSLLVCLDLWPGWCASRCSGIRSRKGVSLNLNTLLGVFSSSPVIEVICYMHTRHGGSLLKIQDAPLSSIDKGSEETQY